MKKLKYITFGIGLIVIFAFSYMKFSNQNLSEIGLNVFSWVKKVRGNNVSINNIDMSKSKLVEHNKWTNLLRQHVSLKGNVDYSGFVNSEPQLNTYLDNLSKNPPAKEWPKEEKLAYWINAYNAFTVKLIVDNYPLESIKDIADGLPMINSPWDIKFFKIGGVDFDLNTIEHEILRKQFDEPRIHFAINCASISCPKLRHEAFISEHLEVQLEDQAKGFINDKTKNQISTKETKLSSIFNWFEGDFTKQGALHLYIAKYNDEINKENSISYLEYNWDLNK